MMLLAAVQLLNVDPPFLVIALMDMIEQDLSSLLAVSVFVLNFLLDVSQILAGDVALKIFTQFLGCRLKIFLVVFKNDRLIVLPQVEGKHVGAHQRLTALA